jgi:hypothetical protein
MKVYSGRIIAAAIVFLTLVSCRRESPHSLVVESVPLTGAVVYGSTLDGAGAARRGIAVHAIAFAAGCAGDTVASGTAISDQAGHYRMALTGWAWPRTACASVKAYTPGLSDTLRAQIAAIGLREQPPALGDDSVRVDFLMP